MILFFYYIIFQEVNFYFLFPPYKIRDKFPKEILILYNAKPIYINSLFIDCIKT